MKNNTFIPLLLLIILFNITASAQSVPGYVPTNSLLAWYAFNGNSNDDSGLGNNATNVSVTFVADRFGSPNSAGSFNGSTAYMVVNTPTFSFGQSDYFTYSFWIYKQTQPAAGIVLMTGTNTAGNFITLIQGGSNETFGTNMQQSAWVYISCPHTLLAWDHYIATYEAGLMKLYKNGVFQTSGTNTYSAATANLPFYIGKGFGGGNFYGLIDDVGVWHRALTQAEITALFNSPVTGVGDAKPSQKLQIYPNPAEKTLRVNCDFTDIGSGYLIIDQTGRTVMKGLITGSDFSMDISSLPRGTYIFETQGKNPHNLTFLKN
jgi:hypothetical protein